MAQAQAESDGELVPSPALIAAQEYLQLLAPWRVEVPYAQWLAANIGYVDNPRILRDFSKLLSLIKSNAILHHRHRQVGADGQVVATPEDYRVVHELVSSIYESSASGASRSIREVVQAVEEVRMGWPSDKRLTQAAIVDHTKDGKKLGAMTVQRAVGHALREGWLVNNALAQRSLNALRYRNHTTARPNAANAQCGGEVLDSHVSLIANFDAVFLKPLPRILTQLSPARNEIVVSSLADIAKYKHRFRNIIERLEHLKRHIGLKGS